MSGNVKVSGAWHSLISARVHVGGTWHVVTSGWVRVGGAWRQWLTALISDAFNRTVAGALGTTDTGQPWTALRGIWYANGALAQSDDTPTSYPLASIEGNSNTQPVSVQPTTGAGVAFWITDAGSWFATVPYAYTANESYTVTQCGPNVNSCAGANCIPSNCCGSVVYSTNCTGPTVSCTDALNSCNPGGCGTVSSSSFAVYSDVGGYSSTACTDSGGTYLGSGVCRFTTTNYTRTQNTSVTTGSCTVWTSASGTRTRYYWTLRILKYAASALSIIAETAVGNNLSGGSPIAAIRASFSGDTITAQAFSDAGMASTIATVSVTPTTPAKGTKYGIVKADSAYAQGSTVDNFIVGA